MENPIKFALSASRTSNNITTTTANHQQFVWHFAIIVQFNCKLPQNSISLKCVCSSCKAFLCSSICAGLKSS